MSLSCLTCQKIIRTDSEKDLQEHDGNNNNTKEEKHLGIFKGKVERASWSGNLAPRRPSYDKMRSSSSLVPMKKVKKTAHQRIHSSGSLESVDQFNVDEQPKLARSCGMRRDWSFEDLRHQTLKA